ncbi:MAG: peptidase C14, partial [Betaproteobacteria bacterium]
MRAALLAPALALAALAAGPAAAAEEARVALVIGNAAYRDSPLVNPVNDAKAVSAALRAAGFEVIERHDQGATDMRRAIREFGEKLRGKEAGLFYFAGHGVQVNGRN